MSEHKMQVYFSPSYCLSENISLEFLLLTGRNRLINHRLLKSNRSSRFFYRFFYIWWPLCEARMLPFQCPIHNIITLDNFWLLTFIFNYFLTLNYTQLKRNSCKLYYTCPSDKVSQTLSNGWEGYVFINLVRCNSLYVKSWLCVLTPCAVEERKKCVFLHSLVGI